ncbi:MAG: RHS repeat-associated core domain-containing protein [Spirochaetales bacterium]|nr:RHS repeat-associated core domain-containing protein [Spirochaetales bacterium]
MFYTGKQWDEDAQLYYFNARWYDPETARFMTEDPIKDGMLWFAYCGNNPLKYTDPTGLETDADSDDPYAMGESNIDDTDDPTPTNPDSDAINYNEFDGPIVELTPFDPKDDHCDINSWNQAIEQGYDPRTPSGESWDGNILTADDIASLYPNKADKPPEGTAGYGFIDNNGDKVVDHVMFYDNTDIDANKYTAYDSDGKEDQFENTWDMSGTTVENGTFAPLDELDEWFRI